MTLIIMSHLGAIWKTTDFVLKCKFRILGNMSKPLHCPLFSMMAIFEYLDLPDISLNSWQRLICVAFVHYLFLILMHFLLSYLCICRFVYLYFCSHNRPPRMSFSGWFVGASGLHTPGFQQGFTCNNKS